MTAQWRPVLGWEGLYDVSDEGQIRSLRSSRLLRPSPGNATGHLQVTLFSAPRRASARVHRVVLEAFVGPAPAGQISCHNDGNPANNRLANLRWDTRVSNAQDALRHGDNFFANKTHCIREHEFTPANTWVHPSTGHRYCRACFALRQRVRRLENLPIEERAS